MPGIAGRNSFLPDVDVGGLEATVGYKPKVDTGAFTYATHAAVVAVDPRRARSRSSTTSSSRIAARW